MTIPDEYRNHRVFSELGSYIDFYKNLSWSIFSFCSTGANATCSIDSYVYSTIQGKLQSIRIILSSGRINDAYVLLRQYYDSVIFNVYSNLYLMGNSGPDHSGVEKVIGWLKGEEQIPEFRIMSNTIRSSDKVAAVNHHLYADDRYEKIKVRCNGRIHYFSFSNVLLNDGASRLEDRLQVLNTFSGDARNVFILHLAYLFFLKEQYMTSFDYLDSPHFETTSEADSRYEAAPFIRQVFDDILAKYRPDIATTIEEYSCMQLD